MCLPKESWKKKSNVQNLRIAGSDKPVRFYNLDVIISIGYRVKSQQGNKDTMIRLIMNMLAPIAPEQPA